MTKFPDFTKLDLGPLEPDQSKSLDRTLATPEGIDLATAYSAADTKGLDFLDDYPGLAPFGRGPYPTMYTQRPGRCGSMRVSQPPKTPTLFIAAISRPVRKAFQSPSI